MSKVKELRELKLPDPNRPLWMYHHGWEPFRPHEYAPNWWAMLKFCLIYPFIYKRYK